jgi:selenide, water dikinase
MREFDIKGATDVTGYSLIGHAWEMARASNVTIEISAKDVPLLDGALELAAAGLTTSGDKTNREYVGRDVQIADSVDKDMVKLMFDPQTAGGMLISSPANKVKALLERLREHYQAAAVIGSVLESGPILIRVVS